MTFEEAQDAAQKWMHREPVILRWLRVETKPSPRVLVKENRTDEYMEFWPSPHKSLGMIEAPEAAAARAQERAAVLDFLFRLEQESTADRALKEGCPKQEASIAADAMAEVLKATREAIERGDHVK